jgi:hypothetical protein
LPYLLYIKFIIKSVLLDTKIFMEEEPGLKPKFLIDRFQSANIHLFSSMPRNGSALPIGWVEPNVVSASMTK